MGKYNLFCHKLYSISITVSWQQQHIYLQHHYCTTHNRESLQQLRHLTGDYHQWNAATAGTGGTIVNANASGSICPKGWKLPSSATNASTITKGTFAYLLQQYGLASAYNSGSLTGTSSVNNNTYNIALSPLFFVRSGYIRPDDTAKFRVAGQIGYYWSSRALSSTDSAYYLHFDDSGVVPSSVFNRYNGQSLRCLISTP